MNPLYADVGKMNPWAKKKIREKRISQIEKSTLANTKMGRDLLRMVKVLEIDLHFVRKAK